MSLVHGTNTVQQYSGSLAHPRGRYLMERRNLMERIKEGTHNTSHDCLKGWLQSSELTEVRGLGPFIRYDNKTNHRKPSQTSPNHHKPPQMTTNHNKPPPEFGTIGSENSGEQANHRKPLQTCTTARIWDDDYSSAGKNK